MKQVMKKLYLALVLATLSIGAKAADYYLSKQTWFSNVSAMTENVLRIKIEKSGGLAKAWDAIKDGTVKCENGTYQLSDFKVVHIYHVDGTPEARALNDTDLATLAELPFETIDLQDAYYYKNGKKSAFTFSNASVKNLILPDEWSKDEVNTCAKGVGSQLGAAISQGTKSDGNASIIAYSNKPASLRTAILHTFDDGHANPKLSSAQGGINMHNSRIINVKYLTLSGNISAVDLYSGDAQNGACRFDSNGHLLFNEPAGDHFYEPNSSISGETRTFDSTNGVAMDGALIGASLTELDLGDAILENEYAEDLTLNQLNCLDDKTCRKVVIPTYSNFNILPADFMNTSIATFQSIMIPRNIQVIGARAFNKLTNLNHVYTEGDVENVVYDNGAVTAVNAGTGEETVVTGADAETANLLYGTMTFGPNLKKIESYAFGGSTHIKDLYVLAIHAPECHVDAFSTVMYVANDHFDRESIKEDGMVTREAYANSRTAYTYMTMLHYPRECGTPDIQRYTDVTREYSIATTLRDGKGATLYLPNQDEYCRAYLQGTTGYLWNAWDVERETTGNNGFEQTSIESDLRKDEGYTSAKQEAANAAYIANNNTEVDKTDRVFYDTTENGKFEKPAGQKNYYETIWEGKQLYPQATTVPLTDEDGNPIMKTVTVTDEDGNIVYEINNTDGTYSKIGTYVADNNGDYVQEVNITENANGEYVKDYSYVKHDDSDGSKGSYYRPYVQNGNTNSWTEGVTYYEYASWYEEDENGEYCFVEDATYWDGSANVHYFPVSTWESWNHTADRPFYSKKEGYRLWDKNTTNYKVLYTLSDTYEAYTSDKGDVTTYDKIYANPVSYRAYDSSKDAGETRYNFEYGEYRTYNESTDANLQRYSIKESYAEDVTSLSSNQTVVDTENKYSVKTQEVQATAVTESKDYRGWHQFVLTAYATNTDVPMVPYRTYIKDNDWWTICLPFDLTKADMILLFGKNGSTASKDIPYLSKLLYVVRDVENTTITLNFSKNLLEYKEDMTETGGTVHGKIATTKGGVADDDIVLHKGVPYLIRPNREPDANGNFKTQFDINYTGDDDLYSRIKASEKLNAEQMNDMIYDGEYTVPALVINDKSNAESKHDVASYSFNNSDGSEFAWATKGQIEHKGKTVDYEMSSDFCYTFVGTFFLSLMPQYSYFLGWDSNANKAAFWYNKVNDPANYTWNNETGIICPNFITSTQIYGAQGLDDPARWKIELKGGDDIKGAAVRMKNVTADSMFGYDMNLFDEATAIEFVENEATDMIESSKKGVYNISGQYMGTSLNGLSKGIYIVNGKKIAVK